MAQVDIAGTRREQLADSCGDVAVRRAETAQAIPPEQIASQAPHIIRREFRRRRAHLVRHGGQSLEQHLFNTFHILTAWRQPARVRYAGLVHSAYSTDLFSHPMFGMNERDQVGALVGETAERLAYLFCTIDRRELLSAVRASAYEARDTFELRNRLNGPAVHLTSAEAGDLLTVYMANAAEQSCRPDRSPARWLSHVSLLGRDARRLAEVTPPLFDNCTKVVSKTEENQLLSYYERLVARLGGTDDSADEPGWRIEMTHPLVAEPLVWMGLRAIADNRAEDAGMLGGRAAARLQQWGTPWDKRLSRRQWLQVCAVLCDTTKADELAFVAQRTAAAAESVPPSPERLYIELSRIGLLSGANRAGTTTSAPTRPVAASDDRPPLPARFQTYIAGLRSNDKKPRMGMYPGLRSMPWHDPQQFQLVRDLETAADEIAAEMRALAGRGFHDEAENIDRSGRWSVLFLYERGRKNEFNCSSCPQTVAVIEANRTVLSLGGLAYFSALEAGTQVAPHRGPTNMRLRCHLGIDVPEDCGLRVGGITRTWQQGRCMVFDDSFTHEAWNSSNRQRLVLIVDLWHPDLTDDEVTLLNGLHRYATATGTGLVRYWNRNRAKASATGQVN